jgi:hypothetical protein
MELKHALQQSQQEHKVDAAYIPTSERELLLLVGAKCFEIVHLEQGDPPVLCSEVPPNQFWDRRIYGENQWNDTRPNESMQWEAVNADFANVPDWARAIVRQVVLPPTS